MVEEQLLEFLKRNDSPRQSEMKRAIGTKSNAVLYKALDSLEDKGFIKRSKGRWGGVSLVSYEDDDAAEGWTTIPLLGIVAAGHPIEAVLTPEKMSVPSTMLRPGHEYFALEVRGDSMIDEKILDGDRIALRHSSTANNGEVVVALIDGENATVKTFRQTGRKVKLIPANRDFETIEVDAERVTIQGVLVGLVRHYEK